MPNWAGLGPDESGSSPGRPAPAAHRFSPSRPGTERDEPDDLTGASTEGGPVSHQPGGLPLWQRHDGEESPLSGKAGTPAVPASGARGWLGGGADFQHDMHRAHGHHPGICPGPGIFQLHVPGHQPVPAHPCEMPTWAPSMPVMAPGLAPQAHFGMGPHAQQERHALYLLIYYILHHIGHVVLDDSHLPAPLIPCDRSRSPADGPRHVPHHNHHAVPKPGW